MKKLIHFQHFLLVEENTNSSYLLLFKLKIRYITLQLTLIHTLNFEEGNKEKGKLGGENFKKGERTKKQREGKLETGRQKEIEEKENNRKHTERSTQIWTTDF